MVSHGRESMGTALTRKVVAILLLSVIFQVPSNTAAPRVAEALDVGDEAPEFTLPSTTGERVSLREFRTKKIVLLEFYGADFSPV
jgi:AhpC/TSA family